MFDFDGDTAWDIDAEAESLNTSLFGKSKKKKWKKSCPAVPVNNDRQPSSFVIHDSDDEQYSKKGKKKLKERRRQKNKKGAQTTKEVSSVHPKEESNDKKSNLNTNKEQKSPGKASKSMVQKQMIPQALHSNLLTKKREKKEKESIGGVDSLVAPNSKKRKRIPSESGENDASPISSKKIKLDDSKTAGEKKKRKRNRKKKNNSKKNKYKHLALNTKVQPLNNSGEEKTVDSSHVSKQTLNNKNSGVNKEKNIQRTSKGEQKVQAAPKTTESSFEKAHDKSATLSQKNTKRPKDLQNTEAQSVKKQKPKKDINLDAEDRAQAIKNNSASQQKKKKKTIKQPKASLEISPITGQLQQHKQTTSPTRDDKQTTVSKLSKELKLKQQKLLKILAETVRNGGGNEDIDRIREGKKKKKKVKDQQEGTLGILSQHSGVDKSQRILNQGKEKTKIPNNTGKKDISSQKTLSSSSKTFSQSPTVAALWGKASELGQQAKEKLNAARFRYLNEQLYTCKGSEAVKMFREDPEAFPVYHDGFENQVSKWPVNPSDVIIKQIKEKPTNLIIADFGCGDARLAQSVPHKVHSFDLVALNDRVTACDMSKTPLPNEKVDVAVFCLSLMGTNIDDYIHEANRILKTGGLLKIAEVVSRFSGLSKFIEGICSHGFQFLNKRDLSEMFYMMDFRKLRRVNKSAATKEIKLKPCIYKKR